MISLTATYSILDFHIFTPNQIYLLVDGLGDCVFPAILNLDSPLVCIAYGLMEWFGLENSSHSTSAMGGAPGASPYLGKVL